MTIEEALRKIAAIEPVYWDSTHLCVYCHATAERLPDFKHEALCPWLVVSTNVKEDIRISAAIEASFPGLMTHGLPEGLRPGSIVGPRKTPKPWKCGNDPSI